MPLFGRKKSEKAKNKDVMGRSSFYDDGQIDAENDKKKSKSKFYAPAEPVVYHAVETRDQDNFYTGDILGARSTLQYDVGPDEWRRRTSALSKNLTQVLHEQEVLPYFVQFMYSRGVEHHLKFWLDVRNFAEAARSRTLSACAMSSDAHQESGATSVLTAPELRTSGSRSSSSCPDANDSISSIRQDAVTIYSRYIALDCTHPIGIDDLLRNATISRMCREDGVVDPLCFSHCQIFVEELMQKQYVDDFLRSPYFRKYQVEILTRDNVHLLDILYNSTAMTYFMEFMEQEGASNLVQFWLAVDNFEAQLTSDTQALLSGEAQADAMVLYERYFSLQATEPLGFTDKVRTHVEMNICKEEGPPADCFVVPKIVVLKSIHTTYFPRFRQSGLYYRYLSELIHAVQIDQIDASEKQGRRRDSASSADTQSVSSQSTAAGRGEPDSSKKDHMVSPRSPQADDLAEQPLWSREHAGNMSLGHVDEYGLFMSQLDAMPDQDKNKGSRFSRKKTEKKKEEEDMAWKIAQMIISAVQLDVSSSNACSGDITGL